MKRGSMSEGSGTRHLVIVGVIGKRGGVLAVKENSVNFTEERVGFS